MCKLQISALVIAVVVITVTGTAMGAGVTRVITPDNPTPGSTFDVTLRITGLQVGGIVERIPTGFTFVSTTHAMNQTSVSGQNVIFAVLNETSISYRVRAPAGGGSGTFRGEWYDALNVTRGDIECKQVNVVTAPSASPAESTPVPTPGLYLITSIAGVIIAAYCCRWRNRDE